LFFYLHLFVEDISPTCALAMTLLLMFLQLPQVLTAPNSPSEEITCGLPVAMLCCSHHQQSIEVSHMILFSSSSSVFSNDNAMNDE